MRPLSIARLLLGLILSANGIAMLAVPETWYLAVPGVFLMPLLSLWLAWPRTLSTKEDHHATMDRTAPARRL